VSATRRIALAVSAAWFSRAVSILSGIIQVPVLFRFMDGEEYGIWIILGNSQTYLALLGLGVVPTLTRHIALAKGISGADPNAALTPETEQHIADLVATGRYVLRGLAVLTFFAAIALGASFVLSINFARVEPSRILTAWLLLCMGYAIGVGVSYLDCWMAGVGFIGWNTLVATLVTAGTVALNIVAVVLGGGVITLACILVTSMLVQRFVLIMLLHWQVPNLFRAVGSWQPRYARNLLRPSLLAWLTVLGAYLVLQTDELFIAKFLGPDEIPQYRTAYQIVSNIHTLAISFALASAVFLSQAWRAGAHEQVRRQTLRYAQIGMALMAAGVGFTLTAGREFYELWTGQANFVGYAVVGVFCLLMTLETQHGILSLCARATEDERYAGVALIAGALKLAFTWWLVQWYGLLGVALGTVLAQMLSTNWYAVVRPMIRLQLDPREYVRRVVAFWALTLAASYLTCLLVTSGLRSGAGQRWMIVLGAAAGAGTCLAVALWISVLGPHHRNRILLALRGLFVKHQVAEECGLPREPTSR
jgi:O-antigen/teichoic acid export membrane protein